MKRSLLALLLFTLVSVTSVFATGEQGSDANAPYNIISANAVSVTVAVGGSGDIDSQRTFAITDGTKVLIDNQPSSAGDLKGGMVAEINTAIDGHTATMINAHDPRKIK